MDKSPSTQENISDTALHYFKKVYSKTNITKRDIFDYVYGILHSKEYKKVYKNDLFTSVCKIPLLKHYKDSQKTAKTSKALQDLHLNYENQKPLKELELTIEKQGIDEKELYKVTKMKLSKDMKTLTYNSHIVIDNIPKEIDEYKINGSNVLKLLVNHYQIKKQENSGLISDPNEYDESKNGKYIYTLVLSLITLSIKSTRLINQLPEIKGNYIETD